MGRAAVEAGLAARMWLCCAGWNLRCRCATPHCAAGSRPTTTRCASGWSCAGHYYQAIQKPGVELVTEAIDHVEPRGVVTADGTLHELDRARARNGLRRPRLRPADGRSSASNGVTLDEAWADGPHAYRSVAVPGFPNLFMLMGPHSPIGNQSLVIIAENQADYAMWWIDQIRDGRDHRGVAHRSGDQGLQRADESRPAADDLGDRMQELVHRQGRAPGALPVAAGSPPRTARLLRKSLDFDVRTA